MERVESVIAIIVSYNRKVLLKEAIDHLLKQSYKDFDILVVDNASTDGTKEYIREYIQNSDIIYHNTGTNLGGAGGFSTGIRIGVEKKYKYLWIMDDDTLTETNTLKALMEAKDLLQKPFGFLCSDVRWTDGSACNMNIPNIEENWYEDTSLLEKGLLRVKQCSFVSCFFSVDIVRELGLPIKEFFIWGDDAEYTKRISMKYPCYFVSNSRVVHKMASNIPTDIIAESPDRLFRYNYSYRNMYYVKKLEGGKLNMFLFYYRTLLEIILIIKSDGKGKRKKIRTICHSMRQRKKFKPKIDYIE